MYNNILCIIRLCPAQLIGNIILEITTQQEHGIGSCGETHQRMFTKARISLMDLTWNHRDSQTLQQTLACFARRRSP